MQSMLKNSLKKLICFAAFLATCGAWATEYVTTWSEDFENPSTYAANLSSVRLDNGILKTTYTTGSSIKANNFHARRYLGKGTTLSGFAGFGARYVDALYTFPDEVKNSSDYILEFYVYCAGSVNGTSAGLSVQGVDDGLFTWVAGYSSNDGSLYLGTNTTVNTFVKKLTVPVRGGDPRTEDPWYHVTIASTNDTLGLTLKIEDRDGVVLSTTNFLNKVEGVASVYFYSSSSSGYSSYCGIDDVVFHTPAVEGRPAAPTFAEVTGTPAGSRVVSLVADDDATIKYRLGESGDYLDYDAKTGISVTESINVYAYSILNTSESPVVRLYVEAGLGSTKLKAPAAMTRRGLTTLYTTADQTSVDQSPTSDFVFTDTRTGECQVIAGDPRLSSNKAHVSFEDIDLSPAIEVVASNENYAISTKVTYTPPSIDYAHYAIVYEYDVCALMSTNSSAGVYAGSADADHSSYYPLTVNNIRIGGNRVLFSKNDRAYWGNAGIDGLNRKSGSSSSDTGILITDLKAGQVLYINASNSSATTNVSDYDSKSCNKTCEYFYSVSAAGDGIVTMAKGNNLYALRVYGTAVASVGGYGKVTFAEARTAAAGTQAITLYAGVEGTISLDPGETLIINNPDGHTISVDAAESGEFHSATSGDVTTYWSVPLYNITVQQPADHIVIGTVTTNDADNVAHTIEPNADGSYTVISNASVTVNFAAANGYAYDSAVSITQTITSATEISTESLPAPTRVAATYTWVGGTGTSWSTPGNWSAKVGTGDAYTPTEAPGALDTVTVSGSDIVITVPAGQAAHAITLNGNKLAFDCTSFTKYELTDLMTLGEGSLSASDLVFNGLDEGTTGLVSSVTSPIKTQVTVANTNDYVWTGLAGDNDNKIDSVNNWVHVDGTDVVEGPKGKAVIFPASLASARMIVNTNTSSDPGGSYYGVTTLVLQRDVTIVGNKAEPTITLALSETPHGSGKIIMEHAGIRGSYLTVDNDIEVLPCSDADGYSQFYIRAGGRWIKLNGKLTGKGHLKLTGDSNDGKDYYLNGETKDFEGTLDVSDTTDDNDFTYHLVAASMNLAKATLVADDNFQIDSLTTDTNLVIGALQSTASFSKLHNNTSYAVTLEVGAINGEDDCSTVQLTLGSKAKAWTVKKVGTGTQTLSNASNSFNANLVGGALRIPAGLALGAVTDNGGKLEIIGTETLIDGEAHTLFTCTNTEALDLSTLVGFDMSDVPNGKCYVPALSQSYDESTATRTVSVTFTPSSYVWTGNGGDNLWSNEKNWQVEDVEAQAAPAGDNPVTIGANAVIYVDPDQAIGSVTADATAKLVVLFTAEGQTFTKPSGITVVAAGPFTMDDSGKSTRVASSFDWTKNADGNWEDVANWKVGDYATAVVPNSDDTVSFGSGLDVTVTLAAGYTVAKVSVAGTATFNSTKMTLTCGELAGSGTVKMNNTWGAVTTTLANFTGTLDLTNAPQSTTNMSSFNACEPVTGNASMKLVLGEGVNYKTKANDTTGYTDYYFGEVSGSGTICGGRNTIVVGDAGSFSFSGELSRTVSNSAAMRIKKVGTGTMTFAGYTRDLSKNTILLEIAEGRVDFASGFDFSKFGTVKFDSSTVTAGFTVTKAQLLADATLDIMTFSGDVTPSDSQVIVNNGANEKWFTRSISGSHYYLTPVMEELAWKWNGTGSNITDANAFTDCDGEKQTYTGNDEVLYFDDEGFESEATTASVVIPSDIAPLRMDFDPSSSKTYKLSGDGKITTITKQYIQLASGTLELNSDVLTNDFDCANGSKITVNPGAGNTINFGALTGAPDISVTSGTLSLNAQLARLSKFNVAEGAKILYNHDTMNEDFRTGTDGYTFVGQGEVVIAAGRSIGAQRYSSPFGGFKGTLTFESGAKYRMSYSPNTAGKSQFGDSETTLILRGLTLSSTFGGSATHNELNMYPHAVTVFAGSENTLGADINALSVTGALSDSGTLNCAGKGVRFSGDNKAFTGTLNFNAGSSEYAAANAGFSKASAAPANGTVNVYTGITLSATDTSATTPASFGTLNVATTGSVNVSSANTYIQIDKGSIAGRITGQAPVVMKTGTDTFEFTEAARYPDGTTFVVAEGAGAIILKNAGINDFKCGDMTAWVAKDGYTNIVHATTNTLIKSALEQWKAGDAAVEIPSGFNVIPSFKNANGATVEISIAPGTNIYRSNAKDEGVVKIVAVTNSVNNLASYYTTTSLTTPNDDGAIIPELNTSSVASAGASMSGATVGDTSVVVATPGNVKKGLYYRLVASETKDGVYEADAGNNYQQATSDNATLSLTNACEFATSPKVIFYKVEVSDTASCN